MVADLSIQVRDESGDVIPHHQEFMIFVWAMIVVYPIGVPLLFFVMLYSNRAAIISWGNSLDAVPKELVYIEWMFHDYRGHQPRLYGEVFDVVRRIILCSVVVLTGSSQVVRSIWGAMIAGMWMQIFSLLQPYHLVATNTIAHIGNVMITFTFVVAFFLIAEPFDIDRSGFGWVMCM